PATRRSKQHTVIVSAIFIGMKVRRFPLNIGSYQRIYTITNCPSSPSLVVRHNVKHRATVYEVCLHSLKVSTIFLTVTQTNYKPFSWKLILSKSTLIQQLIGSSTKTTRTRSNFVKYKNSFLAVSLLARKDIVLQPYCLSMFRIRERNTFQVSFTVKQKSNI